MCSFKFRIPNFLKSCQVNPEKDKIPRATLSGEGPLVKVQTESDLQSEWSGRSPPGVLWFSCILVNTERVDCSAKKEKKKKTPPIYTAFALCNRVKHEDYIFFFFFFLSVLWRLCVWRRTCVWRQEDSIGCHPWECCLTPLRQGSSWTGVYQLR